MKKKKATAAQPLPAQNQIITELLELLNRHIADAKSVATAIRESLAGE